MDQEQETNQTSDQKCVNMCNDSHWIKEMRSQSLGRGPRVVNPGVAAKMSKCNKQTYLRYKFLLHLWVTLKLHAGIEL